MSGQPRSADRVAVQAAPAMLPGMVSINVSSLEARQGARQELRAATAASLPNGVRLRAHTRPARALCRCGGWKDKNFAC